MKVYVMTVLDDRFVGDTNPLVMWIYDVDKDEVEVPVELVTDTCVVTFKYTLEGVTKTITGENMTDLGYVEFPFASDAVVHGEYVFTVRVQNGAEGYGMIYDKGIMPISADA